ncbi:MAG: hypothetical protein JW780_04970 [Clostridiales bacterium]|nr:hypothetical protein [Clostridiales bacterium]
MKCFYHNEREATCTCIGCGKALCSSCGSISKPPRCADCLSQANRKEYNTFLYTLFVSAFFFTMTGIILLLFAGVSAFTSPWWWFLMILVASIPWGWHFLYSLIPIFFISTSVIGMILYLIFSVLLSVFVGIFVMPWKFVKITRLCIKTHRAKKLFR